MSATVTYKDLYSVMNKIEDKQQACAPGKRKIKAAAYDRQNRRQNPPEHIRQKMR